MAETRAELVQTLVFVMRFLSGESRTSKNVWNMAKRASLQEKERDVGKEQGTEKAASPWFHGETFGLRPSAKMEAKGLEPLASR